MLRILIAFVNSMYTYGQQQGSDLGDGQQNSFPKIHSQVFSLYKAIGQTFELAVIVFKYTHNTSMLLSLEEALRQERHVSFSCFAFSFVLNSSRIDDIDLRDDKESN